MSMGEPALKSVMHDKDIEYLKEKVDTIHVAVERINGRVDKHDKELVKMKLKLGLSYYALPILVGVIGFLFRPYIL
jgi:tetrahydromethanopterin S-methyltransferase subunit G|tara:strand:+ start:162 stop:389 length:228 start_codon:yes stop_codon:yes gene_type:complete